MSTRIFALCLAWLVFVADLATAHAAEPGRSTRYADVVVEAQSLGSAGPVIRRRVRERADVVLRRGGVLPPRDGSDPVISIVIDELTGENPGYSFRVEVLREGKADAPGKPTQCGLCTEGELVDAIEGSIERATATLGAGESDATVPPPRVDPTDHGTPIVDEPAGTPPGPGMRIAGASLVGVGLAATIVGAVLAAREPKPKESNPLEETSTKKPGYALIGVGVGLAVTGAVLLIFDARKRSRARRSTVAWR